MIYCLKLFFNENQTLFFEDVLHDIKWKKEMIN